MDIEPTPNSPRSKEEVALELMKFIAMTTSFGKSSTAGFAGKPLKSPVEQVDALLELYEKCRDAVGRKPEAGKT